MAITKIYGPSEGDLNPVYNKIDYIFDSTNKNELGFEYVIELYKTGSTASTDLIYEYRIPPRSSDGYSLVSINRILSNLLSYDIALNTYEYLYVSWNPTMVWKTSVYAILTRYINPSSYPSPYSIGDIITLNTSTTYGDDRDNLNGTASITAFATFLTSNDSIVLDIPYTSGSFLTINTTTELIYNDINVATQSGFGYDISVGESYFGLDWNATSYGTFSGYMSLTGTVSHNDMFIIGDMVNLTTPYYGDDRDLFNGYYRIRNLLSEYTILIDLEDIGLSGSITTNVSLSNIRTTERNLFTQSGMYVWNGVLEHNKFFSYTQDQFKPSTSNRDGEFLLDAPVTSLFLKGVELLRKTIIVGSQSNAYLNYYHKDSSAKEAWS